MALGETLITFTPLNFEVPASNYATLDLRNLHPVLDFDDGAQEHAYFTSVLPKGYSGGGLEVLLHYAMSSAIAGNVLWKAAIERIGGVLDIDGDSFAVFQGIISTVNGTSGIVKIAKITFTNGGEMDSLEAGELFRLSILRHGNHGDDTASGDAELLMIELKEA